MSPAAATFCFLPLSLTMGGGGARNSMVEGRSGASRAARSLANYGQKQSEESGGGGDVG